ncbi:MAG: TetR family transcriptional regulator [Alphaproteobacteria bacterium]
MNMQHGIARKALRVFGEKGVEETSVRDMASAAGIAEGMAPGEASKKTPD